MNNTERLLSAYYATKRNEFKEKRKTTLSSLTLLDIIANGSAVRVFKESVGCFDEGISNRVVVSVRRRHGSGWVAVQKMFPVLQLETAILYANKMAQKVISIESVSAIA
ncbi:TPA: hypothetical protein ACTYZB_004817 [Klebsiella variicola]